MRKKPLILIMEFEHLQRKYLRAERAVGSVSTDCNPGHMMKQESGQRYQLLPTITMKYGLCTIRWLLTPEEHSD